MVTGAGERKDGPQRDDPRVVEKDEGLQGKPSYVYVTTRVYKLKLFPVWKQIHFFENHIHHAFINSFLLYPTPSLSHLFIPSFPHLLTHTHKLSPFLSLTQYLSHSVFFSLTY